MGEREFSIIEFFQGDAGSLSMSRLLMFGSFLIASILMLTIHMNEAYFGMYLGAYAGTYLGGKAIDARNGGEK